MKSPFQEASTGKTHTLRIPGASVKGVSGGLACAFLLAALGGLRAGEPDPGSGPEPAPPALAGNARTPGAAESPGEGDTRMWVDYYFNPGCRGCEAATRTVREMENQYAGHIRVAWKNYGDPEAAQQLLGEFLVMLEVAGQPEDETPALAVYFEDENTLLADHEEIVRRLPGELARRYPEVAAPAGGPGGPGGPDGPGGRRTRNAAGEWGFMGEDGSWTPLAAEWGFMGEDGSWTPLAAPAGPATGQPADGTLTAREEATASWTNITLTALADSINPCAFATMIMLVSMMATARRTRQEIILIGLSFTLAVYLAYAAIALALYEALRRLRTYLLISDLVYYAAFLLCVVCGLMCLYDAFIVWWRKDPGEMKLKLPEGMRRRIQKSLSRGVRASWLVAGTFVAGILVSGLEAICTGQVLFPLMAKIARESFMDALVRVAWYCLVFVLPLLGVFALALVGVTHQQLSGWLKRNLVASKLALAAVFALLGWMVWNDLTWPPGYRDAGGPLQTQEDPSILEPDHARAVGRPAPEPEGPPEAGLPVPEPNSLGAEGPSAAEPESE